MAAKMKDVAERAGVAKATASLVLNGKHESVGIAFETAQRVLAVAEELDYRPSAVARAFYHGKTNTLGYVCGSIQSAFFSELAAMGMKEAQLRGYHLLVSVTEWDREQEAKALYSLIDRGVDGIIASVGLQPGSRQHKFIHRECFPFVTLSGASPGTSTVLADWDVGVRQMFAHLVSAGHKRIGTIVNMNTPCPRKSWRWELCEQLAPEYGVELVVVQLETSTRPAARALGQSLGKDMRGMTACFAFSDHVAASVMRGLADVGVRVPDDIAVVGVDGTAMGAECIPSLTSIRQDSGKLMAAAVDLLTEKIDNSDVPVRSVILPTELIVRESA